MAYFLEFEKPKIIWANLSLKAAFTYDDKNFYLTNPSSILAPGEKWLLAILKSTLFNLFLRSIALERSGGFIEQQPMTVRQIPIPQVSADIKKLLEKKVEELLLLEKERIKFSKQSLEVLVSEYTMKRLSQKLENFLSLGWNEFIEELEIHNIFFLYKKRMN